MKKIPRKYQPKGFEIIYEDRDIIVGNKAEGFLTVAALWNKENTVHSALNQYVRKGNSKSRLCVYVVHRLDQDTTGVMIFAKTQQAQMFLKDNWKSTNKIYLGVVHGRLAQKSGTISSYLAEDEDYVVHSVSDDAKGKLSHTAYTVLEEAEKFSLLKIDLLTGRKNQIRVHFSDAGHPVVGDAKYGKSNTRYPHLALHAQSISLTHPFSRQRMTFEAPVPKYFNELMGNKIGRSGAIKKCLDLG
ncbi:MAG: RluA family pseudouridine synthase [Candidatus Omnitrophica bacterium]|nr:RluA family pseudouridine synthase [Candidatus Omnitrophota bacterium]